MIRKALSILFVLISVLLTISCRQNQSNPTSDPEIPNPASVYCEQNGGILEFRQNDSGGVAGICVFPNRSECDEWAYFRGECMPVDSTPTQAPTSPPTEIPTAMPIALADYQGWWTYTNPTYGFSLLLPSDWVVDEITTGDPLMNGHLLNLIPQNTSENINIRMTFRHISEDVPLWPTGVGSGEFVAQGTLDVAGKPARRILFICPTGEVNEIWYHGAGENEINIQAGDLEFGFILSFSGIYCQDGYSLGGKVQRVGEMIIASLNEP